MGKHAQLVIGPAGSGKSTYCQTIVQHCENIKRPVHVVNLDPAAEHFSYPVSVDIRELISLEDVMEELDYGPNGGLVYCMEYLMENADWLDDQLQDYADDYLLIDCPGQIELYSHLPVMRNVVDQLQKTGYRVCAVYLLDSVFISDSSKFISGVMMCLSAMVQLEVPHINVLTKCDLVKNKKLLNRFLDPDVDSVVEELNKETGGRLASLNAAMGQLITDFSMVNFLPLDPTEEDSIETVLSHIDHAIQYGEDEEPHDRDYDLSLQQEAAHEEAEHFARDMDMGGGGGGTGDGS